ncbi:MFS transporter [Gryllotalpicola reticulitermitis]|uniref:MFS transporter n=1 Tax=Gryllotalpicola reticulitermitis TaxID=1184153 RepID=A0ABV8Q1U1_9MICO
MSISLSAERSAIRKAAYRIIPMILILNFICYLDRVNIGFASLTMNESIGLNAAAYGFGSGIFFIAYFIFEVPSNLLLHRLGARVWIARIMITWGIISSLTFLAHGPVSFYIFRFLLGVAEAGFFPGIILYLTYWFPKRQRALAISAFMAASPLSSVIGAPLSTFVISHSTGFLGLAGWQTMFLIEGIPAIIVGILTIIFLPSRPKDVRWLSVDEKSSLDARLSAEAAEAVVGSKVSVRRALLDGRVIALALIHFGLQFGPYTLSFFLPQIIKTTGSALSVQAVGWITAVPYLFTTVLMLIWARHSDRTRERVWHIAGPMIIGAVVTALAVHLGNFWLEIAAVTVTSIVSYAALPVFWQFPATLLGGTAAAAGIGLVNSVGNLAGFVAPYLTGELVTANHGSYSVSMYVLGAIMLAAALGILLLGRRFGPLLSRPEPPLSELAEDATIQAAS